MWEVTALGFIESFDRYRQNRSHQVYPSNLKDPWTQLSRWSSQLLPHLPANKRTSAAWKVGVQCIRNPSAWLASTEILADALDRVPTKQKWYIMSLLILSWLIGVVSIESATTIAYILCNNGASEPPMPIYLHRKNSLNPKCSLRCRDYAEEFGKAFTSAFRRRRRFT